ncbi:MAG: VOC family protein [Caldilineaceae bacterium]|nr:VOC family protein [Caldilineaceae bacterium]
MIEDFQHVCITCRDIETSIRFYKALGLVVTEPVRELDEEGIGRAFQLPGSHILVAHLAPPAATGNMFIDLVQWVAPPSTGEAYPALDHVGINRLAFRVSNIDETVASLQGRGIAFLTEDAQSFGPIRTIVTTDPDGVFIQLLEWL